MKPNWLRSLWHAGGGLFAIWLYHEQIIFDILRKIGTVRSHEMAIQYLANEKEVAGSIAIVVMCIILFLECLRAILPDGNLLKKWVERPAMRLAKQKERDGAISSMTLYMMGVALLFFSLPKDYACFGIACLAFGDPAACWAGYLASKLGDNWFSRKVRSFDRTIAGSLCMYLVCVAAGCFFLDFSVTVLILAFGATLFEFLCGREWFSQDGFIEDNVMIPVGFLLSFILVGLVQVLI